jgi:hypothetical protein
VTACKAGLDSREFAAILRFFFGSLGLAAVCPPSRYVLRRARQQRKSVLYSLAAVSRIPQCRVVVTVTFVVTAVAFGVP